MMRRRSRMKGCLGLVPVSVCLLHLLSFAVSWVGASLLGVDALNGEVENGRYFLDWHGRLTEVGAGVLTYSLWHARSLFVTTPLAMLMGWLPLRRR